MNHKKVLFHIIASYLIGTSFLGCGCSVAKKTKDDISNGVKEGVDKTENATEGIKDATVNLFDLVKDKTMDYSKEELVRDLKDKGLNVESLEDTSEYFSVEKVAYKINNDAIFIYEYSLSDEDKIKSDINSITDNGNVINGSTVKWTSKPHVYKKGRLMAIYDGKNEDTLNKLKEILGTPILN